MGTISLIDLGIWLVYFAFIFMLLWVYSTTKKDKAYQFYIYAFVIKAMGGLGFALIYIYYYKFGDTFLYQRGAAILTNTFLESPIDYFRLLAAGNGNLPPDLMEFSNSIAYSKGAEEWFMVKLLSPISLLSFNSYLVTTLLMSLLSFFGSWKLFLVLRDILPNKDRYAFIAAFLIPSALFWGAGIMKDTFTLAGINIIIYCLYFTFFKSKISVRKYTFALVTAFIVFSLKGYVLLAFLPALLFGFSSQIKKTISNVVLRRVLGGVLSGLVLLLLVIGPQYLSSTSKKYSAAAIQGRVRGFHTWHSDLGGSTYSLGDIDYTTTGIVSKIPAALNVTFFRPYLWETSNAVVGIAAIESTAMLFLFLYILFHLRFRLFWYIREKPILIVFSIYCLIFGFIVGFTSYNFGALGRYKIPIYSIFVFLLLYLLAKISDKKKMEG